MRDDLLRQRSYFSLLTRMAARLEIIVKMLARPATCSAKKLQVVIWTISLEFVNGLSF